MISLPQTLGLAALGLFATAIAAHGAIGGAEEKAFACGIATTTQQGMLTIEGQVLSPEPLQGSYRFSLRSAGPGGSSTISQSGAFSAQPGEPALLGRMTINAGSNYEATLDLETGGQSIACTDEMARL
ncbi:MAG: hypothetical protein ABS76_02535 [Pelagibacterium sp. SCN 64-44]|mgnify:CR=1 FL=1|nr:MAG: hypothetical protein ABS76_02535 [Pelagibacterium sp. SCN 64-44]